MKNSANMRESTTNCFFLLVSNVIRNIKARMSIRSTCSVNRHTREVSDSSREFM